MDLVMTLAERATVEHVMDEVLTAHRLNLPAHTVQAAIARGNMALSETRSTGYRLSCLAEAANLVLVLVGRGLPMSLSDEIDNVHSQVFKRHGGA